MTNVFLFFFSCRCEAGKKGEKTLCSTYIHKGLMAFGFFFFFFFNAKPASNALLFLFCSFLSAKIPNTSRLRKQTNKQKTDGESVYVQSGLLEC